MKLFVICSLLFVIFSLAISKPLNPKKVVTAINCGSNSGAKSSLGFYYQADKGFKGGRTADYGINPEASGATVKYTRDPHIYFTERHDDYSLKYEIDLAKDGKFVLILKFSEMKFTEKNQRVFHVRLGERRVKENVDPAGTVGRYAAFDEYIPFELKNDMVYSNNQLCEGAYNPASRKLIFELEKTEKDNPMIMGIVLYEGDLEDTDFYEIPAMRQDWERKLNEERKRKEEEKIRKEAAKLKKREKVKVRNDHVEDFEEDFDDGSDNLEAANKGLLQMLTSPTGLFVTFGSLIGVVILVLMNKNAIAVSRESGAKTDLISGLEKEKPKPSTKTAGSHKKKK